MMVLALLVLVKSNSLKLKGFANSWWVAVGLWEAVSSLLGTWTALFCLVVVELAAVLVNLSDGEWGKAIGPHLRLHHLLS